MAVKVFLSLYLDWSKTVTFALMASNYDDYHLNIDLVLADSQPDTSTNAIKNDPVVINELLSFLDIGYIDGFKDSLTAAEADARLAPNLCTNLYNDLAQLKLTTIRSQLMAVIDEN